MFTLLPIANGLISQLSFCVFNQGRKICESRKYLLIGVRAKLITNNTGLVIAKQRLSPQWNFTIRGATTKREFSMTKYVRLDRVRLKISLSMGTGTYIQIQIEILAGMR